MNARVSAAAVLLLVAHGALAATASVSASADWGALNFQFLPAGATFTADAQNTTTYLDVPDGTSQQSSADWSSPISVSISDAGANAMAGADNATLSISSSIDSGQTVTGNALASYGPTTERTGQLTISGNGILLITIPAKASASVAGGNEDFPTLFSTSSVELRLSAGAVSNSESLSASANFFGSPSDLLTQDVAGLLVSGLNVKDGDIVSFAITLRGYASVQNYVTFEKSLNPVPLSLSAVPLPASVFLFGPALGGLGLWRRRRA